MPDSSRATDPDASTIGAACGCSNSTVAAPASTTKTSSAATAPPTEYVLHVGGISVSAMVVGDALDVMPIGPGALPQPMRRTAPAVAPTDLLELAVEPASVA